MKTADLVRLFVLAAIWGAIVSAIWLGERLAMKKITRLLAGVLGVALVTGFGAH